MDWSKNFRRFLTLALGIVSLSAYARGDVVLNPGDNIQQAVNNNPPGTTFHLNAGVYWQQSVQPLDADSFIGDPGALLSGAELLTTFISSGPYYVVTGQTQQGQQGDPSDCDAAHPGCYYPEDLFFDNVPLQHMTQLSDVGPGKWFFDYPNQTIYFVDNPAGHIVETSVTRSAFWGSASNVTISGLIVEMYAIPAQMGAIGDQYPGGGWIVTNNEVLLNHGRGINVGVNGQCNGNHIHDNGEMGLGDTNGSLAQNNEINSNNWAGYSCGWECGGAKFVANGLVVQGNYVHDNLGPGLWTDVNSLNINYIGNTVVNNMNAGIQHEISGQALITGNTLIGNGWGNAGWAWDAQIQVQNSSDVVVSSNTIEVSPSAGNGIFIIQQCRGTLPNCAYPAQNNYIHDNNITFLGTGGGQGLDEDMGSTVPFSAAADNLFDYNHYHVTDLSTTHWAWADGNITFSGFQNDGQELHGTVDTVIMATTPSFALTQSANPVSIPAGGSPVTFTIQYQNAGAPIVSNAVITDTVPANSTLVPGTITGDGILSGGVITWTLGSVVGYSSGTVSFQVTPAMASASLTSTASVGYADAAGGLYSASNTLTVLGLPPPDLNGLPKFFPVAGTLNLAYPNPTVAFQWTFTPQTASSSLLTIPRTGTQAPGTAGAITFKTSSQLANLGLYALGVGDYQVTVVAVDSQGHQSSPGVGTITLVEANLNNVLVYPNPWRQDRHNGKPITFTLLPVNSEIQLFAVSGHRVKTLSAPNGTISWDLTNDSGESVASGLYMYLITSPSGKTRGKLAILK